MAGESAMVSEEGSVNGWLLIVGLVLLPVLGVMAFWLHAGLTHPAINDIVTDPAQPVTFRGMPAAVPYPVAAFESRQRESYPQVRPLLLEVTPQRAYEQALNLVRARGWTVVLEDAEGLRVEATVRSLIFRFTDEVAVQVSAVDVGARVDMRSRSRVGRSDLGVNVKRIQALLSDIEARMRHDAAVPG